MMTSGSADGGTAPGGHHDTAQHYKRDFWIEENLKHSVPHYRLQKVARIANELAGGRECDLLDVGCGPATLQHLLTGNIRYFGIDIAIHEPAPNLSETDFLEAPIGFGGRQFDIVVAQGVFEYIGEFQDQKLAEIAGLLGQAGTFIVTYTNFDHRNKHLFEAFSNIQPPGEFRQSLARHFRVDRFFPSSHNPSGGQPARKLVKAVNMRVNRNIPLVSPRFAVEYIAICSSRRTTARTPTAGT